MTVTQKSSLSHVATDKLRNYSFQVIIRPHGSGKALTMGFMTVDGLSMNIDVIPYREGGYNITTQKLPGQADFNPITMSHGVAAGKDQEDLAWIQQLFTVMQGTGNQAFGADFRMDVDINVLGTPAPVWSNAPVQAAFRVYNAWPTTIAYSTLDAGANQVYVSQLGLAHEGWDLHIAEGSTADAPKF
jgi:phage tail-like protein